MIVIDTKSDASLLHELSDKLLNKKITQKQRHYYGKKLKNMMEKAFIYNGK